MIQHFIITPFSFRRSNYIQGKTPDPLKLSVLESRLSIFESITLPSMLAQENKEFTWIILVDKLLPDSFRLRLQNMIKDIKIVFLHNFEDSINGNNLTWLSQYVKQGVTNVITSKVDADDAIFKGFSRYIYEYYSSLHLKNKLPPLHFLTCRNVLQWDFFHASKAPFGYLKPWTRPNVTTVATGLTVCSKYPDFNFSILGIGHHLVDFLFLNAAEISHVPNKHETFRVRYFNEIKQRIAENKLVWNGVLHKESNYHEVKEKGNHIIMVNHLNNDILLRLFEASHLRVAVNRSTSLPEFGLNFNFVERIIKQNKKSIVLYIRVIYSILFREHLNINENKDIGFIGVLKRKKKKIERALIGLKKLK